MASISYTTEGLGDVAFQNVLEFDVTTSEEPSISAEVTKHGVERGADLADHVRAARPSMTFRAVVSNTPIYSIGRLVGVWLPRTLSTSTDVLSDGAGFMPRREALVRGGFTAPYRPPGAPRPHFGVDVIGGQLEQRPQSVIAQVKTFQTVQDRLRDVWDELSKLCTDGTPVTVSSRLGDFDNMIITRVGAPVTVLDAIEFTISVEQIGYYDSLTFASVNKVAKTKTKAAEPPKNEGSKMLRTVQRETKRSNLAAIAKYSADAIHGPSEDSLATVTPMP